MEDFEWKLGKILGGFESMGISPNNLGLSFKVLKRKPR
jgi:hypothetical protein